MRYSHAYYFFGFTGDNDLFTNLVMVPKLGTPVTFNFICVVIIMRKDSFTTLGYED